MASVWGELKRRNVIKVAMVYAVVTWLLMQIVDTAAPALHLPEWTLSLITLLLIVGFPFALIFAWAFELTPEGIKPSRSIEPADNTTHSTGRKIDFIIIGVLVLAVAFLIIERFVLIDESPVVVVESIKDISPTAEAIEPTSTNLEEPQRDVLSNSIAVIPFANVSPDPDDAYFATGIHEEILNQLAKISALNVIARTSVLQYANTEKSVQEIASEMNVETVMEGSVRYAGGQVRITTQLNDGVTGAHLWSETYTRDFEDIFAIESDVAMNVANALEAEFSLEERDNIEKVPTNSPAAYALYLRSIQANTTDYLERIDYLNEATTIDPDFALAYGHKAQIYATLFDSSLISPSEAENGARDNANTALELDPAIGIAHAALAKIHEHYWQGPEALAEYELALKLAPNDPIILRAYGLFMSSTGNSEEAIRIGHRVIALDPKISTGYQYLGHTYRIAGDLENAAANYEIAVAIVPMNFGPLFMTAYMATVRGDYDTAVSKLRLIEDYTPIINSWVLPRMAYLYALTGRSEDAKRLVDELKQRDTDDEGSVSSVTWAYAHIALGDYDTALIKLNEAIGNNKPGDKVLFNELRVNGLRIPELENNPEFLAARKRIPGY